MSYSRVAMYQLKPGTVEEVVQRAEQELKPILRQLPGYIAYQVQKGSEEKVISISAWQSKEEAEAANQRIERWVAANIADTVVSVQSYISNIVFTYDQSLIV